MRMRHIVIFGLSDSVIFYHIISLNGTIFEKFIGHKMFVLDFLHIFWLQHFSSKKMSAAYDIHGHDGLHVKCPLFLSDFNGIFSTDFRKILKCNIFYENPSSESRVVPYGQTDVQTRRS
jgi:hypothetical protein